MASPPFRAASSGNGTGSSITLTEPAGAADGDFQVLVVQVPSPNNAGGPTITTPSGWALDTNGAYENWGLHKVFYRVRSGAGTLSVTLSASSIYAWQMVNYQRNGTGVLTRDNSFSEADQSIPGGADTSMSSAAHSAAQNDSTYILVAMCDINPVSTTLGAWSSGTATFRVKREDSGIRTSDGIGDVVNRSAGSNGGYSLQWTNDAALWGQRVFTMIIYELLAKAPPPRLFNRRLVRWPVRRQF